jgi:hypothetical protein
LKKYVFIKGAFLRPEFAQYFASSPFGRSANPLLRNKIIFPNSSSSSLLSSSSLSSSTLQQQQQQQQQSIDLYLNGQDKLHASSESDIASPNNSD